MNDKSSLNSKYYESDQQPFVQSLVPYLCGIASAVILILYD